MLQTRSQQTARPVMRLATHDLTSNQAVPRLDVWSALLCFVVVERAHQRVDKMPTQPRMLLNVTGVFRWLRVRRRVAKRTALSKFGWLPSPRSKVGDATGSSESAQTAECPSFSLDELQSFTPFPVPTMQCLGSAQGSKPSPDPEPFMVLGSATICLEQDFPLSDSPRSPLVVVRELADNPRNGTVPLAKLARGLNPPTGTALAKDGTGKLWRLHQ
jgi:hypothetical protein